MKVGRVVPSELRPKGAGEDAEEGHQGKLHDEEEVAKGEVVAPASGVGARQQLVWQRAAIATIAKPACVRSWRLGGYFLKKKETRERGGCFVCVCVCVCVCVYYFFGF